MEKKSMVRYLIVLFMISTPLFPQEPAAYTSVVYGELLGSGGLYSVNYERMFTDRSSVRVGVSYADLSQSILDVHYAAIPVMFNQMFFSLRNQMELGAGVVVVKMFQPDPPNIIDNFSRNVRSMNGVTYIGYRDWNEQSRILFRFGCTQFFNDHGIGISGGLSLGYIFF